MARRESYVELEVRKGKYVDEIRFYLVNARGCTNKLADQVLANEAVLIDSWFNQTAKSARVVEPPVNAVQASRILLAKFVKEK